MQELGLQYSKDAQMDNSGFLARARLHQSKYRAKMNLPFDKYGNYLTKEGGENGFNFYSGFDIFKAVKDYRKYNKHLYSNMLRSEHIPFNFFIPFRQDFIFCKNVFNEVLGGCIKSVDKNAIIDKKENIKIEYAPKPAKDYLNDRTSFDAYIEYTHNDGGKGIIGIEVKYTEREYEISGKTEELAINDEKSKYHTVSNDCCLYKPNTLNILKTNNYRQIWRNQLLGESIVLHRAKEFKHFTSMIFFPNGNEHFVDVTQKYMNMLESNQNRFVPVKYEDFFDYLAKYSPNDEYSEWINYLIDRYIAKEND